MTAAGFALPFGVVFVVQLARRAFNSTQASRTASAPRFDRDSIGGLTPPRSPIVALLAMALPLMVGFVVLGIHNRAITGRAMTSPYQLFNDVYTPRHVFGFNNVVRGEQHLGPRVLDHYDRWAENLTPTLAIENAKNRLLAAWQWTVGLVPLLAGLVVFVVGHVSNAPGSARSEAPNDGNVENVPNGRDWRWWLIFASIVSLFAVHVPYWFDGMFHWHYVFETGPLWCLVLAAGTDTVCRSWLSAERPRMPSGGPR